MSDLAKRAVACSGWEWLPRMVDTDGNTYLGGCVWHYVHDDGVGYVSDGVRFDRALPDLTDPATLGCLLALVREAWDEPDDLVPIPIFPMLDDDGNVTWCRGKAGPFPGHPTEAEALVAALEAAQ